jgi:hypothetical protein
MSMSWDECGLGSGRVEIISMSVAGTVHVPKAAEVVALASCNLQGMVDAGKFSSISNFPE